MAEIHYQGCGVLALISKHDLAPQFDKDKFIKALSLLQHRGPNDFGTWVNRKLWLGHRRLAILGSKITDGIQPRHSRQSVLCYNGEIYNCEELRSFFQIQCKEKTDTEILQYLLDTIGPEKSFSKLKGMFAFIYHNKINGKTYFVRDQLGIKPLFFYTNNSFSIFASEIAPIIFLLGKAEYDIDNIKKQILFTSALVDQEKTLIKNIHFFTPGKVLEIGDNGNTTEIINDYRFVSRRSTLNYRDKLEKLEELLHISCKRHLISSVPVTLSVSGGLDSSLIMSMVNNYGDYGGYTIRYELAGSDMKIEDLESAKIFAKEKGYAIQEVKIDLSDLNFEYLCNIIELHSLSDDIRFFALDKMYSHIKNKTDNTVILIGQGADELFGGYISLHGYDNLEPKNSKIIIEKLLQNRFAIGAFNEVEKRNLFETNLSYLESLVCNSDDYYRQLLISNQLRRVLAFEDHFSMRHSLEARVPFLDKDIIEFAKELELCDMFFHDLKSNQKIDKRILSEIGNKYLPKLITNRKKSPYPTIPSAMITELLNNMFKNSQKILCQSDLMNQVFKKMDQEFWKKCCNRTKWNILVLIALERKVNSILS